MNAKVSPKYLIGALLAVVSTGTLLGQNTTGTIVGHIKDPAGAAIPNAKVSIIETDTKDVRSVVTNSNGDYTAPLLKPGHYQVEVESPGFKGETQSGILLNVDQTVRTDISLTVGSTAETVSVSAAAVSLDTDSASVGEVISGKLIGDLPLNGRNFQDLLITTPGAVNNGGGEQGTQRIVISGDGNSSIGVGGSRGASNGYTLDGSSIIDLGEQSPAFQPSLDDIDEFKVQTKVYSASYGFNATQVTLSSKGGTNSFHGSAFEYLRNNYVDATPHGSMPGVTIPLLQQNQFGYSVGGPARIPKIYNGRDKTFFFANYEGFRQNVAGGGKALVPTLDQLAGNFSQEFLGVIPAGGGRTQCGKTYNPGDPFPLFDPQTGCPFPLVNGVYSIPGGSISALGKLAQRPGLYFPASGPDLTPLVLGGPNYAVNTTTTLKYDQQNYRIDQTIGKNDTAFFHMTWHNENESQGGQTPASGLLNVQPARFYTFTETHTFTPTFTNQFRIGYVAATSGYHEPLAITEADLDSLNLPSPYHLSLDGYPRLLFGNSDASTLNDQINPSPVSQESPVSHISTTWDGSDTAYKVIGRHSLSVGAELRRNRYKYLVGGGLGYFTFDGQYSGDDIADLLLGVPAGIDTVQVGPLASPTLGATGHVHLNSFGVYVQDDWKATSDLTLNLGLRYEYHQTPFEEDGDMFSPDFSAPEGALYVANKSIAATYGGTNPFGGSLYIPTSGNSVLTGSQKSTFAPRVGFAYRPFHDDKTVVRGGFGLFYDSYESNEFSNSSGFYPLSEGVSTNTGSGVLPLSYPAFYNMNALPAASTSGPVVSEWLPNSPSTGDTNGNSPLGFIVQIGGNYRQPYVENWAFGIERELPYKTTLEVDYVGNKMTHLFDRQNPNQPYQCNAATSCEVTEPTPNNYVPTTPNQDRVPYKNLGTLVNTLFNGWGNYNALDVKVEHRTSDLSLITSYTWSKQMDTASSVAGLSGDAAGWAGPQDSHNVAGDYSRGDFNVGQRLVVSGVYSLPVGRGKAVLPNASRLLDEAIGGWQAAGIILFQGGLPFSVTAPDLGGSTGTYAERANRNLSKPPVGFHRSNNEWFSSSVAFNDPNAEYTQPLPGLYGNSQRNDVNGPGQEDFDLSAIKVFPIVESLNMQFRVDAFNALNHYNPGGPNSGLGTGAGFIDPSSSQRNARILQASARFTF